MQQIELALLPVLSVHNGGVGPGQVEGPDDILLPIGAGNVQTGLALSLQKIMNLFKIYCTVDIKTRCWWSLLNMFFLFKLSF
jgi:hypothetical protein